MKERLSLVVLMFFFISSSLWSGIMKEFDFKLIYGENIHGTIQNFPICVGFESKISPLKFLYGKIDYKVFPNFTHVMCGSIGINVGLFKEVYLFFEYGEAFYVTRRFMTNFHSIMSSGVQYRLSEKCKLDFYYSRRGDSKNVDNFFIAFKYSFN